MWRIEQGGHRFALRVFRAGSARSMRRSAENATAMDVARTHGLPIPGVSGNGVWHDRPALLMDWMPGQPLQA